MRLARDIPIADFKLIRFPEDFAKSTESNFSRVFRTRSRWESMRNSRLSPPGTDPLDGSIVLDGNCGRMHACMQEALQARNERIAFTQLSRVRRRVRVPGVTGIVFFENGRRRLLPLSRIRLSRLRISDDADVFAPRALTVLYSAISDLKGFTPRYIEPRSS